MTEDSHNIPLLGDPFPEMEVQTTQGPKSLPGEFAGKWFILFSHPADFTPVCTTEFVSFQQRLEEFRSLGCELIGLSVDQVFSHIKWVEWIGENMEVKIEFPIIADDGEVAYSLGIIHPGKGSNTVRAVFLVDPKGIVRAILYYPQELGRSISEIVRMVKAIQISDSKGVAMPADWPSNSIVGANVIVPPAKDVNAARERLESDQHECLDWWFCHRKP